MNNGAAMKAAVDSAPTRLHYAKAWRSDLVRNITGTYLTQTVRIAMSLLLTVVVARLLGPAGRGEYAVAIAIGALGVQFGSLGLHTSNTYFAAKYPERIPALFGNTIASSLGIGVALSVMVFIVGIGSPSITRLSPGMLALAVAWIPFGLAFLLTQNLLLGMQNVRLFNYSELVNRLVPVLLLGSLFFAGAVSPKSVFGTTLIGLVVTVAWLFCAAKRAIPQPPQFSKEVFQSTFAYATRSYIAALFCFVVLRSSLFIVQYSLGSVQAGLYSIATAMADAVSMLPVAIGTVLFPRLSASSDTWAKLKLTSRAVWITAAITAPLLVVAACLASSVVGMVFGKDFLPAARAFVFLTPGVFFLGIHSVAVQFLNSIGYPKSVAWVWAGCAAGSAPLTLWVVPRYGIEGASVIASVIYAAASVCIIALARFHGRKSGESQ